jgi:soluble lytic murein transglycosylase
MQKTNKSRKSGTVLLFLLLIAAIALFFAAYRGYYKAAYPRGYSETVLEYSAINDLPPALVFAIIWTESGFRPDAVSSVGARGLMQITEDTFEWIRWRKGKDDIHTYEDLFNPELNIEYGTDLLRILFDEFGTVSNVLAAYHAGWGSAKIWLANPEFSPDGVNITHIPFPDTNYYVHRVLETWETYRQLYRIA